MALIFHDLGKSDGMEGHAIASARLAERVLERMQMPESERRTVLFLIEHHLDLSAIMNSRDLNDPATASELAARVETLENLKLLTLMTYSDISAVNPDAMTPWRLEQLWRTYIVGHTGTDSGLGHRAYSCSDKGRKGRLSRRLSNPVSANSHRGSDPAAYAVEAGG